MIDRQQLILDESETDLADTVERLEGAPILHKWYLGNRKIMLEQRIRFLKRVLAERKQNDAA